MPSRTVRVAPFWFSSVSRVGSNAERGSGRPTSRVAVPWTLGVYRVIKLEGRAEDDADDFADIRVDEIEADVAGLGCGTPRRRDGRCRQRRARRLEDGQPIATLPNHAVLTRGRPLQRTRRLE